MAWITGNGSSVGPGIMRTGRVWHWAQLMVTLTLLCSDSLEVGSHRGWPEIDATRLRTPGLEAGREVGSALWFVDPRPICSVPRGAAPPVNLAGALFGSWFYLALDARNSSMRLTTGRARDRAGRSRGRGHRRRGRRPDPG